MKSKIPLLGLLLGRNAQSEIADSTSMADKDAASLASVSHNRRFETISSDWCQAWGASIEKPHNDVLVTNGGELVARKNEDRFRLGFAVPGALIAGVSDGAGGQGLFCGDWAETLLGQLPPCPIETGVELNNWLEGFWERFQQTFKERAKSDPFVYRKFVKEGSYATLAAAWLTRDETGAKFGALVYGDSPLFVWSLAEECPTLRLLCPSNLSAFLHDPHLLNWRDEAQSERLQTLSNINLTPGEAIVLASDGIGQYLLFRYLYGSPIADQSDAALHLRATAEELRIEQSSKLSRLIQAHEAEPDLSFADEFALLRRGFGNIETFADFIGERFERGLVPNDDCTVVVVSV